MLDQPTGSQYNNEEAADAIGIPQHNEQTLKRAAWQAAWKERRVRAAMDELETIVARETAEQRAALEAAEKELADAEQRAHERHAELVELCKRYDDEAVDANNAFREEGVAVRTALPDAASYFNGTVVVRKKTHVVEYDYTRNGPVWEWVEKFHPAYLTIDWNAAEKHAGEPDCPIDLEITYQTVANLEKVYDALKDDPEFSNVDHSSTWVQIETPAEAADHLSQMADETRIDPPALSDDLEDDEIPF